MVDVEKKELISPDGIKFPPSKVLVHWVLGLPYGPKPIPNDVCGESTRREIQDLWRCYGSTLKGGTRAITSKAIVDAVDYPAELS